MAEMYRNIAYELESALRQMRLKGMMRLPTEDELCRRYSCSRQTVRAALDLLVQKGLIVKKRGSGSYISDKITASVCNVILIVEDEYEYIYPDLISSLRSSLKKKGYDLRCISTKGSYEKERDALKEVLASSPAAVIIEPISDILPNPNMPLMDKIRIKEIPVIYLYASYPSPDGSICIREDNASGSDMLVSYLKENGHPVISSIFRCDDSRGLERYRGFVDALHKYGLPFDQDRSFFYTGSDRKKLLSGNDDFLRRTVEGMAPDVSAVITQNDEIAFRLLKVLQKSGRSGISVASFDNSYFASGPASISSLGHSSRDLITAASDAVTAAVDHRSFTPPPVRWHLHARNG
ncbi:MAG: GntR family transcriptional regulator [Clostridiales bacterium]|nr:GntR family transcriptional regulator [Clostridiales bacterium]